MRSGRSLSSYNWRRSRIRCRWACNDAFAVHREPVLLISIDVCKNLPARQLLMETRKKFYQIVRLACARSLMSVCAVLLLSGCIAEDEDNALVLLGLAAATANTSTPLQSACQQSLRTINGIVAGQLMNFVSNPSTTGASNTQIAFAVGTMSLTDEFALASTAAVMTDASVEIYAGDACSAVNTAAVSSRLTNCTGGANLASCQVTVAGSYIFQVAYSAAVGDMQVSIGTP